MRPAARRVLVTGADGFIGSPLVERLLADGHEGAAVMRTTSEGAGLPDDVAGAGGQLRP